VICREGITSLRVIIDNTLSDSVIISLLVEISLEILVIYKRKTRVVSKIKRLTKVPAVAAKPNLKFDIGLLVIWVLCCLCC